MKIISVDFALCKWLFQWCSCLARIASRCVFYLLDHNERTLYFRIRKVKINYILNFTTKDFYGLFCLLQFFLYSAGFVGNKVTSDFYIRKTILRQRCQIGHGSGNAQIILFTIPFVFRKFFRTTMDCRDVFKL